MGILTNFNTYLAMLRSDPVRFIIIMLLSIVAILATLIFHEVAHGWVAWKCGDPTAKMMGRLSLDPRKHLDPIGTACLVLFSFGWAKPVPVNPRNFRGDYRRDDFLVSVAGVTVNLTLFIISYIVCFFLGRARYSDFLYYVYYFFSMFYRINLGIAVFNLLPIPPLDGFHVLNDLILKSKLSMNPQFFQIAQFILIALCFTGALSGILSTITGAIEGGMYNLLTAIAGA